jgi:hypothetical protein
MTQPKTISWSHSALKDFEGCQRRYHEVRVLKKWPFVQSEEAQYGDRLHKDAECYVRDGKPLQPEFEFMQPMLDRLKAKRGRMLVEYEMALTKELVACAWRDWNRVWVRGKADLMVVDDDNLTAWVVDYKSGSNKYVDFDQLVLMSLMVFEHFPHIRHVKSALIFVLKNDMRTMQMDRDAKDGHWWKYREKTAKLEAAYERGSWPPSQSGLCRKYCPVTTCEHNGNH